MNKKWTDKITNEELWRITQQASRKSDKKKKMAVDWTHITQRSRNNGENRIRLESLGI
jgi:hypothetical protein